MGSLRKGRAAVHQTGPGRGPRNLSLSQRGQRPQGLAVPTPAPLSGLLPRPSGGLVALPCHVSEHTVEEEGRGEE